MAGTSKLPGKKANQTVTANSGGAFATVFNNNKVDGSFGVTTAITLQDVNATTGAVNHTLNISPSVAVTSFSSKSELSLNVTQTGRSQVVTFMGYAGAPLGALDVSNSDTTA